MERYAVVVDRRKWFRGHGGTVSSLMVSSGKMCCLGFVCKKIDPRVTDAMLRASKMPASLLLRGAGSLVDSSLRLLLMTPLPHSAGLFTNKEEVNMAAMINDEVLGTKMPAFSEPLTSEADREARIIDKLALLGIDITFEN